MEAINHGMEQTYGCTIEFSCPPMYPPVLNDYDLYRQFVRLTDENYEELKEPLMLAEDFSFYQKEVPGIFFYVGTKHQNILAVYTQKHLILMKKS